MNKNPVFNREIVSVFDLYACSLLSPRYGAVSLLSQLLKVAASQLLPAQRSQTRSLPRTAILETESRELAAAERPREKGTRGPR